MEKAVWAGARARVSNENGGSLPIWKVEIREGLDRVFVARRLSNRRMLRTQMMVNRSVPHIDALIVNLIAPDPRIILEQDTTVELWQIMFDTIVHPLYAWSTQRCRKCGRAEPVRL
jgi:hypothetical protein